MLRIATTSSYMRREQYIDRYCVVSLNNHAPNSILLVHMFGGTPHALLS